MHAVERARVDAGERKRGARDLGDVRRHLLLLDADADQTRALGAGRAQHVQPGTVAEVHLESEAFGGLEHFEVGVDRRDLGAFEQAPRA